jgi:hypothetical protein
LLGYNFGIILTNNSNSLSGQVVLLEKPSELSSGAIEIKVVSSSQPGTDREMDAMDRSFVCPLTWVLYSRAPGLRPPLPFLEPGPDLRGV